MYVNFEDCMEGRALWLLFARHRSDNAAGNAGADAFVEKSFGEELDSAEVGLVDSKAKINNNW